MDTLFVWRLIPFVISIFSFHSHELRNRRRGPACESVFSGEFPLFVFFPVVPRCVVSDGEAGAALVVELDVSRDFILELVAASALLYVEVDAELFLYPAVQRLVDGVVRGLACPGHGADDVGVLYEFVVGDRRIDASLVGVQHRRFAVPLQQAHHVGEPIQILVAGASAFGDPVGEDLLGEHVEVEGDLEVVYPELEGGHV